MGQPVTHSDALSLKQWAQNNHIAYRTAWRMYRSNRLPKSLRAEQLPTGTIRLYPATTTPELGAAVTKGAVIYARIHPRQSKVDLDAQIEACKTFCFSHGWIVLDVIREVAGAVGEKRGKLRRLMENPPCRLVILTRTVMSRFDFTIIEECLKRCGCFITVIDESQEISGEGAALEDLVDAISLTCRKHYGQKRGALLVEALQKLLKTNSS